MLGDKWNRNIFLEILERTIHEYIAYDTDCKKNHSLFERQKLQSMFLMEYKHLEIISWWPQLSLISRKETVFFYENFPHVCKLLWKYLKWYSRGVFVGLKVLYSFFLNFLALIYKKNIENVYPSCVAHVIDHVNEDIMWPHQKKFTCQPDLTSID